MLRLYGLLFRLYALLLGVRVTSWCRSAEFNASVGGVSDSRHLVCAAIDCGIETASWKIKLLRLLSNHSSRNGQHKGTGLHWHLEAGVLCLLPVVVVVVGWRVLS